jgi:hypothetical protein
MDFTTLVAAVDTTTLLAGITSLAALKMSPGVAKWGYSKVIGWFR